MKHKIMAGDGAAPLADTPLSGRRGGAWTMLHLGGARQPACQASRRGIAGQDLALRGPGGLHLDPETAGRARSSEEIPVKGVPIKREIARGEPQRLAGPLEARSSPIVPALLEDVCFLHG